MKAKLSLLLCFLWLYHELTAQSYFEWSTLDSNLVFTGVAAHCIRGGLNERANKLVAINYIDNKNDKQGFCLMNFSEIDDISSGLKCQLTAESPIITKILSGNGAYFFLLGTVKTDNWGSYPFLATYDARLKRIVAAKLFTPSQGNNQNFELVDAVFSNDKYYLLLKTQVEYLGNMNDKIMVICYDGNVIEWSYIYNTTAPIHSESAMNIAIDPNDHVAVAGTIKAAGDPYERMMLGEISKSGEAIQLKRIELFAPNQAYSHRYGKTFLHSRLTNLHLFAQSIIGRSEPGPLLITMFDINYALRTWRDYSMPIRVENSLVSREFFLVGGQAPVEAGFKAYTLSRINSTNAIVEAVRSFEKGVDNFSPATTSANCYDDQFDKVWTFIKDNDSIVNDLLVIENDGNLDHVCSAKLESSVAKDTIKIQEIAFSAKPYEFIPSDLRFEVEEIPSQLNKICGTTHISALEKQRRIKATYNPYTHCIQFENDILFERMVIHDIMGHQIISSNMTYSQLNCTLIPGLYSVFGMSTNGIPYVGKITVAY